MQVDTGISQPEPQEVVCKGGQRHPTEAEFRLEALRLLQDRFPTCDAFEKIVQDYRRLTDEEKNELLRQLGISTSEAQVQNFIYNTELNSQATPDQGSEGDRNGLPIINTGDVPVQDTKTTFLTAAQIRAGEVKPLVRLLKQSSRFQYFQKMLIESGEKKGWNADRTEEIITQIVSRNLARHADTIIKQLSDCFIQPQEGEDAQLEVHVNGLLFVADQLATSFSRAVARSPEAFTSAAVSEQQLSEEKFPLPAARNGAQHWPTVRIGQR